MSILFKFFQKLERRDHFQIDFMRLELLSHQRQKRTVQENAKQVSQMKTDTKLLLGQINSALKWPCSRVSWVYLWGAKMIRLTVINRCDAWHQESSCTNCTSIWFNVSNKIQYTFIIKIVHNSEWNAISSIL